MRKNYIDNLRWIMILLLIPYHAAMAWNVWKEPNYIYFEGSRSISSIIVFLSPYFMPLLFVLSGISTRLALKKRTKRQYMLERGRRLLVPFVFGTLFFMPVMTYIADKFHNAYSGTVFQHYRIFFTKFTDFTGSDGGFSVGQFWFVLYLFVISLIAAGVIALQKKAAFECKKNVPLWLVCVYGMPLPLLNGLISIGGKSLAEYAYLFLAGYYVFSDDLVIHKAEKYKWIFLTAGLAATVLNVYLLIWSGKQHTLLYTAAKFVSEWFMVIALLGIGTRYMSFHGKVSGYMSQRSFLFYNLHFVWVVLFQYKMYDVFSNYRMLLYVVPVFCAYCATFLCCEICIRIPLLCFLMGTKGSCCIRRYAKSGKR